MLGGFDRFSTSPKLFFFNGFGHMSPIGQRQTMSVRVNTTQQICQKKTLSTLRLPTPPMETPDPPGANSGASKQVVLTPHDIPRSLRVIPDHSPILVIPDHSPTSRTNLLRSEEFMLRTLFVETCPREIPQTLEGSGQ